MAPDGNKPSGSNAQQSPINFNLLEDPTSSLLFPQPFNLPDAQTGWAPSPAWPMSGQQSPGVGFPNFNPMAMNNLLSMQDNQQGYNEGHNIMANENASNQNQGPFAQNGSVDVAIESNTPGPAAAKQSVTTARGETKEADSSGQENNQDRAARLRAQLIAQRNARGQTRTPDNKSGPAQRPPNPSVARPSSALGETGADATSGLSGTAATPSKPIHVKGQADAKSTPSSRAQTVPRTSVEIDALIAEARDRPDSAKPAVQKPATPVGQSVIAQIRKEEASRKEEERQRTLHKIAQKNRANSRNTPSAEISNNVEQERAQKASKEKLDVASKLAPVNGSVTDMAAVRGATPARSEAGAASLEDGEIQDEPTPPEAPPEAPHDPKDPKPAQPVQKDADLQVQTGAEPAAKASATETRKARFPSPFPAVSFENC